MVCYRTRVVPAPPDDGPPPQALAAGLTTLTFNEPFQTIDPNVWNFRDFWMGANTYGYVDLGGLRTFNVNQPFPHPELVPYMPASLIPDGLRLTCRRARLAERPALRELINSIAVTQDPGLVDRTTWIGAFMTTELRHPYAPADIARPAYIEARIRFSPSGTRGIFSSFWVYDTSEQAGSDEIDIFETNDGTPDFWKTNFHPGPSLQHFSPWCDGNFHTFGMLWEANSIKIYFDNSLSGVVSGTDAAFYSRPLRLMITHTCDAHWMEALGITVPPSIEEVNMDFKFVKVWQAP